MTQEDPFIALKEAFDAYAAAREIDNSPDELPNAPQKLIAVLDCLLDCGYTKKDQMFALDVEPLTIERWRRDGKGTKNDTFKTLANLVEKILSGRPQRPISVSDTGFISWKTLFSNRQRWADRIWYVSSSHFLINRSVFLRDSLREVFVSDDSDKDYNDKKKTNLIYLYPKGSQTESDLLEWRRYLLLDDKMSSLSGGDKLIGSIFGIGIENKAELPWFMPGLRTMILEKERDSQKSELEGYVRVRQPPQIRESLIKALDQNDDEPHSPWLEVAPDIVTRWYISCRNYLPLIETARREQDKDFDVHILSSVDGISTEESALVP